MCLDNITEKFSIYPLQGKLKNDKKRCYQQSESKPKDLPPVPKSVSGCADIMIGITYLRFHPKLIFQILSNLAIFECMFRNSNGSNDVIVVSEKLFPEIDKKLHHCVINSTQLKNLSTRQF